MRLIRIFLVLAAGFMLMPSPPQQSSGEALQAAAGGIGAICPADQGVCGTAAYLADRLQAKAFYSAELMFEWALDATRDPASPFGSLEARVEPSGAGMEFASAPLDTGSSTLRLDDLLPEWRGPAPRDHKEG